ncbi:MAG TPA: hypothetical protein VKM55_11280 [Candidatus Lokiarchaeia archaeon]|nr:hypothetical protein [Candidatus Lokiarchaeia archaeon]
MPPRAALLSIPYNPQYGEEWCLEAEFMPAEECSSELVIICHPHPVFGGEMHNNVVNALFHGLSDTRCTARFNFSGVGGSDGIHENGIGEINQVKSVLAYMENEFARERCDGNWTMIHLVGYSFGAAMALGAAWSSPLVVSCTTIALPFEMFAQQSTSCVDAYKDKPIPLLFLIGSHDDYTPLPVFNEWTGRFASSSQYILPGADHFFSGFEKILISEIKQYLDGLIQDIS